MAWDGSGNFSRTDGTRTGAEVWTEADAASVSILSADHDTHDQDLADGIENCLTIDGLAGFLPTLLHQSPPLRFRRDRRR